MQGVLVKLIGSATGDEGRLFSDAYSDDGARFPIEGGLTGVRFFEYKWNEVAWKNLQGMIDRAEYVTATMTEANLSQRNLTVLPVRQRDTVSFAGLKTVVIQLEIQKDIPTSEGSSWNFSADAVLVNS